MEKNQVEELASEQVDEETTTKKQNTHDPRQGALCLSLPPMGVGDGAYDGRPPNTWA